MKKQFLVISILALLLLSACSGDTLPTDIQNVGGTIVKEEDLLPTHDMDNIGGIQTGQNGNIDLTQAQEGQMTAEDAKSWIADCVSGEYQMVEEGDIVTESAPLKDGGTAKVTTYCGFYYSTEFRYPENMDGIFEKAAACLRAYIGRAMTDAEEEELQDAMVAVSNGLDTMFLSSMDGTAYVYVFLEDSEMVVQCS